eukprot:14825041-Alexandrium_andersonii.AAC.1
MARRVRPHLSHGVHHGTHHAQRRGGEVPPVRRELAGRAQATHVPLQSPTKRRMRSLWPAV